MKTYDIQINEWQRAQLAKALRALPLIDVSIDDVEEHAILIAMFECLPRDEDLAPDSLHAFCL